MQGSACACWVRCGRVIVAAGLVWSVAAVWNAALAAGFQPSETVFPDTTRAWLSISDPRGLRERFDRSNYGQMVADPAMKPFIDGVKEQISKNGRQRLEKLGLTLEDFEGIPGGELAVAAIESQPGQLATVLIVDTTGHEAAAKALVEKITARLVERKSKVVPINGAPPQLTAYQIPDDLQDDRVPKNRRVAFALAPQGARRRRRRAPGRPGLRRARAGPQRQPRLHDGVCRRGPALPEGPAGSDRSRPLVCRAARIRQGVSSRQPAQGKPQGSRLRCHSRPPGLRRREGRRGVVAFGEGRMPSGTTR